MGLRPDEAALGGRVLDGVLHQVVQDLMYIVVGGQRHGILVRRAGYGHALLLGHHGQHTLHALQHRPHRHGIGLLHHAAVQPRQPQQVLGNAAQPFRLPPDVGDELLCGLLVHVIRLQDGVRKQPYARQRCFQLVAGVGDEPPPGVLRGLQSVGQAVEFRRDLGDLVGAAGVSPVAVRALTHLADGLQKPADLPGQHLAEHDAQPRHQQGDQQRDNEQVVPERLQQLRLLRVVVIGVHRAHDLVVIHHRRGHAAQKRRAVVAAIAGVLSPQGHRHHGVQRVFAHGVAALPGVVQHQSRAVGHHDTGRAGLVQALQRRLHVLHRQLLQAHHRRLDDLRGALQVVLIGGHHHVLAHQQRIGVQQDQHRRDDQDIAQAELQLQGRLAPQLAYTKAQALPRSLRLRGLVRICCRRVTRWAVLLP